MSIGKLIKEYRIIRGLTQEELATRIGKSRIMIYNYENEKSELPELVKKRIIEILDIPNEVIENDEFDEIFQPIEISDFNKNIEFLELLGFNVLFDKNNDVYLYKENNLVLKTSKSNINDLIRFKKIDKIIDNKNFNEPYFFKYLKEYANELCEVKINEKTVDSLKKEYYLEYKNKKIDLTDDFLYSLLFMSLNILDREIKGLIEIMENETDKLKKNK